MLRNEALTPLPPGGAQELSLRWPSPSPPSSPPQGACPASLATTLKHPAGQWGGGVDTATGGVQEWPLLRWADSLVPPAPALPACAHGSLSAPWGPAGGLLPHTCSTAGRAGGGRRGGQGRSGATRPSSDWAQHSPNPHPGCFLLALPPPPLHLKLRCPEDPAKAKRDRSPTPLTIPFL